MTTHIDYILESVFSHGSMFTLILELARVPRQGYQCWAQHSPLLGILGRQIGQEGLGRAHRDLESGVITPASCEGHELSLAYPHVPGT